MDKTVDDYLNEVDYSVDPLYVPSEFALEFVSFLKLVNGDKGEEHKTPVMHYHMLDNIAGKKQNTANMAHRGSSKTSIFSEYLFLYIATYGGIPGFGDVGFAMYVSDSVENGVKNLRKVKSVRRRELRSISFLSKRIKSPKPIEH